jgi:hypothetical protein
VWAFDPFAFHTVGKPTRAYGRETSPAGDEGSSEGLRIRRSCVLQGCAATARQSQVPLQ